VTGRPAVTIDRADAVCVSVMIDRIELWLRHADPGVLASLAASFYGEPTPRALQWTRQLISDLRYFSAALTFALRAGEDDDSHDTSF
jgi:hypothetical protein